MIINPKYTPFSYDKRIAPLKAYKEEYDDVAEGLETLAKDTGTYSSTIPEDSESGRKIAAYNQTLDSASAAIASGGLKSIDRGTLIDLRRLYQQEISPINAAAKTQAALQKQIDDAAVKHPDILFGKLPSVDELVANPSARPTEVSAKKLEESGRVLAQGLSQDEILILGSGATTEDLNKKVSSSMEAIAQQYNIADLQNPGAAAQSIAKGFQDTVFNNARKLVAEDLRRKAEARGRSGGGGGSRSGNKGDDFYTDENGIVWRKASTYTHTQEEAARNIPGFEEQEIGGVKYYKTTKKEEKPKAQSAPIGVSTGTYNTDGTAIKDSDVKGEFKKKSWEKMTLPERQIVNKLFTTGYDSSKLGTLDQYYAFELAYDEKGNVVAVKSRKLPQNAPVGSESKGAETKPEEKKEVVDENMGLN